MGALAPTLMPLSPEPLDLTAWEAAGPITQTPWPCTRPRGPLPGLRTEQMGAEIRDSSVLSVARLVCAPPPLPTEAPEPNPLRVAPRWVSPQQPSHHQTF